MNNISNAVIKKGGKRKLSLMLLIISLSASQSFAQYEMKKYTVNSGGANMSGGSYAMSSSIGQVDASNTLVGGDYSLSSGFWQENNDLIFKNNFENL